MNCLPFAVYSLPFFFFFCRSGDVFQRAESSFGPRARCGPAASDGLLLRPASSQRLWPGHWEHCPISRRRWHAPDPGNRTHPATQPHTHLAIHHTHISCRLLVFRPGLSLQPSSQGTNLCCRVLPVPSAVKTLMLQHLLAAMMEAYSCW